MNNNARFWFAFKLNFVPVCRFSLKNYVIIFQWKTLWAWLHDIWRHCKSFDVAYPWKWLLIELVLTAIPFREQQPLQNWAWRLLKSSTLCLHGTRRRKHWPTMQSDADRPWTTASKPRLKAWKQRGSFYQSSANKIFTLSDLQWTCDHSKRTLVFLVTFQPFVHSHDPSQSERCMAAHFLETFNQLSCCFWPIWLFNEIK